MSRRRRPSKGRGKKKSRRTGISRVSLGGIVTGKQIGRAHV